MPVWIYWIVAIGVLSALAAAVYRMLRRGQTERAYRNHAVPYEGESYGENG